MDTIQLKSGSDFEGKNKGYESTYKFYDENGDLIFSCDIYGECIKLSTVLTSPRGGDHGFVMKAKGKFLNFTYFLEDDIGARFATITRKGIGFRWKILGEKDHEIARIIDPTSRKEAFFRELLSTSPGSYAGIVNNDLVAIIQNRQLSEKIRKKSKSFIGRLIDKAIGQPGLTLQIEPKYIANFDTRILVAGMTLLRVHDIMGVNRQ
ncbi:MAG: hypothetical protein WBN03_22630 [Desulfobacterales bacterium]